MAIATLLFALLALHSVLAIQPGFPYGSSKVRGVNIGGWLVLEVCALLAVWHDNSPKFVALDHSISV